MTALRRNLAAAGLLGAGLGLVLLIAGAGDAAAQHYEGCFVNGQQVPDSECEDGGGGGYSGGGGCNVICQGLRALIWGPSGPSAEEIARRRSNALNNEGGNLYHQGRTAEALEKFQQAIAADPDNAVAQANFYGITGEVDFRSGRLDDALANSQRALEYARRNDPRYGDNRSNYQNIASNISMIKAAIAYRKTQARQQFAAGEQELLDQIRPVHATPVVVNASPKDDGYVPHPVARLAGDPRDYPDLPSYTKDQHIAHDMNRDGVQSAEIFHDWPTAMSNFAAAYDYDPTGPFAKVIRQNMETAAKHLDQERAARAQAAAAVANPKPKAPPHSAQSAHASAKSTASDAQPKQVLPKTYTQCNAEFQSRTNSCQRADGSWDRAGCFDPAKRRFEGCLKGLTDASFR
jgi:tetratricopeptide (TPR) repeat protein